MAGATAAFIIGWMQWRRGQEWQRAEQLDKFVMKFESDPLLKLAAVVLDWSDRTVKFGEDDFEVKNDEVLLALRDHQMIEDSNKFPGGQPTLRDAYDALLSFFNRLELAITTGLVDSEPAKTYFAYWLEKLVTFEGHEADKDVLGGEKPAKLVAAYIWVYGDVDSINNLCKEFEIDPPDFEAAQPLVYERKSMTTKRGNACVIVN
jgi:hypothetical protein